MFFTLSTWELALVLAGTLFGATAVGIAIGRSQRHHSEVLRAPFGVSQGALLSVVGLILAFGLAMAVTRYESRRDATVAEANAIGTAYLRAQTIAEPQRSRSLALYPSYTGTSIRLSLAVPQSAAAKQAIAEEDRMQRGLWRLAGESLNTQPVDSAPRLYVESLNTMIDAQTTRISALNNRVPNTILLLQVVAAAIALSLLGLNLAIYSRGVAPVLLAATVVTMLLYVSFDLDRPARGFIRVPDAPLTALRAEMKLPPAAAAPNP